MRHRITISKNRSTLFTMFFMGLLTCNFVNPTQVSAQLKIEFEPIPNADELNSPNAVQALDIAYDDIDPIRQAFHIFLPDTTGTFPLVIYYHGGGFINGSRDNIYSNPNLQRSLQYFLENGIGFVSAGYRLIETDDDEGVIKCLGDSKRALQFIRHHSNELRIDPERVALMGGSAGAGTALWIGTRDDLADSTSSDPVLQESTRVSAIQLGGSQATYDLTKWETVVYSKFGFTIDDAVELLGFDRLSNFYGGLDSVDQLFEVPELIQYRQDADMLFHMTSDDPPIYILSRSPALLPEEDLLHHGAHSLSILTQALESGIEEVKARINFMNIDTTDGECGDAFLARQLGVETGLVGDVNNDGIINLLDIDPFIDVLTNASPFTFRADINCDGRVNLLDVNGFVTLITG